jgi:hypothetical protein
MRGSALRAFGGASNPCAARGLAGDFIPVHPDQEAALPLCGTPASEAFRSDTFDRSVRPLETRAQRALLSETSAPDEGGAPFQHLSRMHRCSVHS